MVIKTVETNPQNLLIKNIPIFVKTVIQYEDDTIPPPVNNPPIADAGIDQTVLPKTNVTLDGTKSYDPDGDAITFQWKQTSGTPVQLQNANSAQATFVAPDVLEPPPGEEIKLEPVSIVASSEDVGKEARNVNDESYDTRWSADGDGEWIEFVFDTQYHITRVELSGYHTDRTYYFEIKGKRFENRPSTTGALQSYDLRDLNINDSAVRIICHGNSNTSYNSYREIHFYTGEQPPPPPPTGEQPVAVIKPDVLQGQPSAILTVDGSQSKNAVKYLWDVDGDLILVGAVDGPTTQFKIVGGQGCVVNLTVTNNQGKTNTVSKQVIVTDEPPPPPPNGDVLWDSNIHLKVDKETRVTSTFGSQAINGKGIFMAASGSPRLIIQPDGIFHLEAGKGHGRVYIQCQNYNCYYEGEVRFNDNVIRNTTWRLRSRHNEGGDCPNRFGGFGATCEMEEQLAEYATESCHNFHENTIKKALAKKMVVGQWLKFRFYVCDSADRKSVRFKTEYDYNDGKGWVTVLSGVHNSPKDYYMAEDDFLVKRSYAWLRINNESTGKVTYRNVKIIKLQRGALDSSVSLRTAMKEEGIIYGGRSADEDCDEDENESARFRSAIADGGDNNTVTRFLGSSISDSSTSTNTETLSFELKVTDSKGASNTDSTTVTVTTAEEPPPPPPPEDPIARLSVPSTIPQGGTLNLDASGSANYDTLTLTQTLGNTQNIQKISQTLWQVVNVSSGGGTSWQLGFQLVAQKGTKQSVVQVAIQIVTVPPPPPPTGVLKVGHIGDTHGRSGGHTGIKNMFEREKVNFMIHSGDITDDESSADSYVNFMKSLGKEYGKDFANAQGNHSSSEENGEGAQADMENAYPVLKTSKWLQFYHIKNVVIIFGNTQIPNYSQMDSPASAHVQQSLVKAKQLKDSGQADWVIFIQHKPMYVIRNAGHSAEYNFRYNFHPLFDQYGVDIYCDGHTHLEHRTLPLIFGGEGTNIPPKVNDKVINGAHNMSVSPHGTICCVNGSSTKSHSLDEETNPWTSFASDSGNAYTVFEIDGKNLTGKYIDITTGNIRHEFKATKAGGVPPPVTCPAGQCKDPITKLCRPIRVNEIADPVTNECKPVSQPPPAEGELKFNISGDFRDTPETGTNLISDSPDLILSTGDYGIGTPASEWCNNVMKMWKDSGIETWGALGNHDNNQYLSQNFFKNTSWQWTLKKGTIGFVAANTITENVSDCNTRLAELQNDSSVKLIWVLMHEGIFHPKVGTSVTSDTTLEFHNTFKKYSKVKVVQCGHTHVYGRSKPIDNILYLMVGIGGQSPSTGSTSPNPFHKINGALHCVLNQDGSITCNCVPNEGDAPGIMDKFTIGSNGELPTDGVIFERRD